MHCAPMLNLYPDSLGGDLSHTADFLSMPEVRGAFGSLYILPSLYHTDLDRGFSVISYDLSKDLASAEDLKRIRDLKIDLTLDLILNHLSVLSPQFQDLLRDPDSIYRDFFIDWNRFWEGCGEIGPDGVLQPRAEYLREMPLRKPTLPVLNVRLPDGRDVPYWNTFYQKVLWPEPDEAEWMDVLGIQYPTARRLRATVHALLGQGLTPAQMDLGAFGEAGEGAKEYLNAHRRYLGQMDVNILSPLVWQYYRDTLRTIAGYGARLVRLDAFSRLHKAPGRRNFMNEPETWDILERLNAMARENGMETLPEIHDTYASGTYKTLAAHGCPVYDFFLPGLILDAVETGDPAYLAAWGREIYENGFETVNMLGCHDGIPIKDLRGILPETRRQQLIRTVAERGGIPKMIHGATEEVYQISCTYYSALGCDERKLLLARALQLFMPGKPQIWYADLLACENDLSCLKKDPQADSKEINRMNLSMEEVKARLEKPAVREQLKMLRLVMQCPAFGPGAVWEAKTGPNGCLTIFRARGNSAVTLKCDLKKTEYTLSVCE